MADISIRVPTVEEYLEEIDKLCQDLFERTRSFTPMYPMVFVLVCQKTQKIGHIITPEKQNKTVHEGIVLATWPDKIVERGTVNKDGIRLTRCEVLKSECRLGDRVLFHHYAGCPPPDPYDKDRFRFVRERDWQETNQGGIYAKVNYDEAELSPIDGVIDLVHEAVPEAGLGYYDTAIASLLRAKIADKFLVVERDTHSVTLSGR